MRDLSGNVVVDRETVESALQRKQRTLARRTAEPLSPQHPLDTATKAIGIAEVKGAIDVLEEILHDLPAPDDVLPETHTKVIEECIAEAWRNLQSGDPEAQSSADVAADIIRWLNRIYLNEE